MLSRMFLFDNPRIVVLRGLSSEIRYRELDRVFNDRIGDR